MTEAQNKIFGNFSKGMAKNVHDPDKRNEYYDEAWNAVPINTHHSRNGLAPEGAIWAYCKMPGRFIGGCYLEDRDKFLVFVENGGVEIGWIKKFGKKGVYEKICQDKDFGCDWSRECQIIKTETKTYRTCVETTIYFSSNCLVYRIPLDEMLDKRKENYKTCDDVKLLKPACMPNIDLKAIPARGTTLSPGSYQVATRLRDDNDTETNIFEASVPVSIGSENNVPGEPGSGYLEINLSNLNGNFNRVDIIVITRVNGTKKIQQVDTVYYSEGQLTYYYYGPTGREIDIDMPTLVEMKPMWIKAGDVHQYNNKLYLYRITPERNFKFTDYLSQVKVTGYEAFVPASEAHLHRTFLANERYAPGWWVNYADGTRSVVVPILEAGTGGTSSTGGPTQTEPTTPDSPPTTDTENEEDTGGTTGGGDHGDPDQPGGVDIRSSAPTDTGQDTFKAVRQEYEEEPEFAGFANQMTQIIRSFQKKLADSCKCQECGQGDCSQDMPKVDDLAAKYLSFVGRLIRSSGTGENKDDPYETITENNIPAAINSMIDDIIENSKDKKQKKAEYKANVTAQTASARAGVPNKHAAAGGGKVIVGGDVQLKVVNTTYNHPETKNCDGTPLYGSYAGNAQRIFQFPDRSQFPLVIGGGGAVPNRYHSDGSPLANTYISIFGIKVTGLPDPNDPAFLALLPKPICKKRPIEVGMAIRDEANSTVKGKGLFITCFEGISHGKRQAYPKHGVNSVERCDDGINNGGSHLGSSGDNQHMVFFSPDTLFKQRPLGNIVQAYPENEMYGNGWRYNLHAKGEEPDSWTKNRIDVRGARQFVALNSSSALSGGAVDVSGIMYADANDTVTAGPGIDLDLNNKYRPRCVYLKTGGTFPALSHGGAGSYDDLSFRMDGLDHEAPVKSAAAHYGSIVADVPGQYGSVVLRHYQKVGLEVAEGETSVQGLVGDCFVGNFTFRRSSKISPNQGDKKLELPIEPFATIFRFFGMRDTTEFPKSGDKSDPKNEANGYGYQHWDEIGTSAATKDIYFWKIQNTLVSFFCECEVNLYYRQSGSVQLGEVFYNKLKSLDFDPAFPDGTPWENCWMTRFRAEVKRPSRWQKFIQVLIRVFFGMVVPMWWASKLPETPQADDTITYLGLTGLMSTVWYTAIFMMSRNEILKKYLDIPDLKPDDENGAVQDERIRGFEDNFYGYDWTHSRGDDINILLGAPDPYDTCVCDDCHNGNFYDCNRKAMTNNAIRASNEQNLDSNVDAYRAFNANAVTKLKQNKGRLVKLVNWNNNLYAITTAGIQALYIRDDAIASQQSLTGADSFAFTSTVDPYEGLDEGMYGTRHPNSILTCPYGVVIIDDRAKSIYLFAGFNSVKDLCDEQYGMSIFMKRWLFHCTLDENPCTSCVDKKNPKGPYFSTGYDPERKRLIISKNEPDGASWSASFDLVNMQWIGFHDWVGEHFLSDRGYMYSTKGDTMYCHRSAPEKGFLNFYGEKHSFRLTFPVTMSRYVTASPEFLEMFSFARKYFEDGTFLAQEDVFFDTVHAYNDDQSTGVRIIRSIDDENELSGQSEIAGTIKVSKDLKRWVINGFTDIYDKKQKMFTRDNACDPFPKINQGAHNYTAGMEPHETTMEDYYIMFNFVYNGSDSSVELEVTGYGMKHLANSQK